MGKSIQTLKGGEEKVPRQQGMFTGTQDSLGIIIVMVHQTIYYAVFQYPFALYAFVIVFKVQPHRLHY